MQVIKSNAAKITKVSRLVNGKFEFYSLGNFTFKSANNGLSYTRPDFVIGLVKSDEPNPSRTSFLSVLGDYLFSDIEGNLSLVPSSRLSLYVA